MIFCCIVGDIRLIGFIWIVMGFNIVDFVSRFKDFGMVVVYSSVCLVLTVLVVSFIIFFNCFFIFILSILLVSFIIK